MVLVRLAGVVLKMAENPAHGGIRHGDLPVIHKLSHVLLVKIKRIVEKRAAYISAKFFLWKRRKATDGWDLATQANTCG